MRRGHLILMAGAVLAWVVLMSLTVNSLIEQADQGKRIDRIERQQKHERNPEKRAERKQASGQNVSEGGGSQPTQPASQQPSPPSSGPPSTPPGDPPPEPPEPPPDPPRPVSDLLDEVCRVNALGVRVCL